MYTNGQAKGLAASFINFVLSAEGQQIVAEEGFVPLN
jgi:ABC-type phosphate transport system substrate-binding protein